MIFREERGDVCSRVDVKSVMRLLNVKTGSWIVTAVVLTHNGQRIAVDDREVHKCREFGEIWESIDQSDMTMVMKIVEMVKWKGTLGMSQH